MSSRTLYGFLLLSIVCFSPRAVTVASLVPGILGAESNESSSLNLTFGSPADIARAPSTDGSHSFGGWGSDDDDPFDQAFPRLGCVGVKG